MTSIIGGFTDKYYTACKSSNDSLRLRSDPSVTCFPDLGHSDYESAYILGSSVENFATKSGGRVYWTVATFVWYSLFAKIEFMAFVVGHGCMNAFLLFAWKFSPL